MSVRTRFVGLPTECVRGLRTLGVLALAALLFAGGAQAGVEERARLLDRGVAPGFVSPPVVSGDPREGRTLASTAGVWTGTEPFAYAYRWQRCTVPNLIGNSGFESDLAGWEAFGGAQLSRVGERARSGSYSLKAVLPGKEWVAGVRYSLPASAIDPSREYRWVAYVYSSVSGATLSIWANIVSASGTSTTSSSDSWTLAVGWNRLSTRFAPSPGTSLELHVGVPFKQALTIYLDDAWSNSCATIEGATGPSYTLARADVGWRVSSLVTATNGYGGASYGGTQTDEVLYEWDVEPAFQGPVFASEAEAAAAEPSAQAAAATSLPTWRNLYDWPNGHGYVGWHSASAGAAGAYSFETNLGGNFGLWLWPTGGQEYFDGNYGEWTYTTPGTTRIANVELDFAYRNKLLAHHCIAVGLRAGDAIIALDEHCRPVVPPESQRNVHVTLTDPSGNPSSKVLFVRIRVDCKNTDPTPCSKNIPQLDPLQTAGYIRVKNVDMTLVDDDNPTVVASEPFRDLDQGYIDGRGSYDLTISSRDAGAGIQRSWAERIGAGELVGADAPCDPTHHTDALDNRICPDSFSFTRTIATEQLPEGTNRFVAEASDPAGNIGESPGWTIFVDRTPPSPASAFTLAEFDPVEGAGEIDWQPGNDPPLPDGVPGSGLASHEYRFDVNGAGWTPWTATGKGGIYFDGVAVGDLVTLEVREIDGVGNVSAIASAAITIVAVEGPEPEEVAATDSEEDALMRDFAVSAGEAADRIDRQPAIEDMDQYLSDTAGDRYGGLWVDHDDGGRVRVATTQAGLTVGLAALFGLPDSLVDEVQVDRTFNELEAIADDVFLRVGSITQPLSRPSTEVDVVENRVTVRVPNPFDGQVQQLLSELRAQYGPAIQIVVDATRLEMLACTRYQCPPPLRGGIEIWRPVRDELQAICTAGFIARNEAGAKFVLTAGHCGTGVWRHGRKARRIGSVSRRQLGGRIDSELIKIDDPDFWKPENWIFHKAASPAFKVTSVARKVSVGTYLCHSGRTTGTHCGRVVSLSLSFRNILKGMAKVQGCSNHGDSGGPVYNARRHRAYGVLSTGTGCSSGKADFWGFEPVRFTLAAFDVTIVTE